MLNEKTVMDALKTVFDPEIPVNIVDLGLIYTVDIDVDVVKVRMTLTAVGCPMHSVISENARRAVESLERVRRADVEIVWEPRWTPDRISPEGRKSLGMQ